MSKTKKMTTITMLVAISIVFHMVEAMIPLPMIVPGFKLGLANIVGLVTLYLFDSKAMISVNLLRVVFASLLKGMLFSTGFWLSLSGVLCSMVATILAKRYTPMSIYGVSVVGSSFHSVGQVIAVTLIYQQFFMQAVLPILIALGIPTGLGIAYLARQVVERLK